MIPRVSRYCTTPRWSQKGDTIRKRNNREGFCRRLKQRFTSNRAVKFGTRCAPPSSKAMKDKLTQQVDRSPRKRERGNKREETLSRQVSISLLLVCPTGFISLIDIIYSHSHVQPYTPSSVRACTNMNPYGGRGVEETWERKGGVVTKAETS